VHVKDKRVTTLFCFSGSVTNQPLDAASHVSQPDTPQINIGSACHVDMQAISCKVNLTDQRVEVQQITDTQIKDAGRYGFVFNQVLHGGALLFLCCNTSLMIIDTLSVIFFNIVER
jgi:hypothetical protein